ncbi:histidine kinase [Halobacterium yunchengense]|uniref:histidine kinase n=1 Tax=Halobacterium yunchengense TaxID=3108497 RepID=UPI00300824CD
MSSDSGGLVGAVASNPFAGEWNWRAGALAGFLAAVVAGVAVSVVRLETLRLAVAGLYGFEGSLLAGWVAHLVHGVVFGLVFAWVLSDPGFYHLADSWWKTLLAAVAYAVVLAVAGAGIIMPIWLGLLGGPALGPLPYVTWSLFGWHVLYGVVLGVAYPVVEHRVAPDR